MVRNLTNVKLVIKSFSDHSSMRSHEIIHRKGKPYQCMGCNKFFADLPAFEVHVKINKDNCGNEKVVPIDFIY